MIGYIEGTCIDIDEKYAVILASGVGYKIYLGEDTLRALTLDSKNAFWIYTSVKEDAIDLFGFIDRDDLQFFEMLLSVSGIGPRGALGILSVAPIETLSTAIATGDIGYLTKISGIGKKTAEKIVIELRDKMISKNKGGRERGGALQGESDAIEALKSLGYSIPEARRAIQNLDPSITDTNEKIKAALRLLSK
jgi:Holliday junction DNA helicase RuvA